jgi:hypothetical protein
MAMIRGNFRLPATRQPSSQSRSKDILAALVAQDRDPTLMIEMYYWSREPGMLDIIRAIAAMPEESRASVEAFLTMSHEPASIAADWDGAGRLTLSSPQVDQTMAIIRYCAENDDAETSPMPN